MVAAVREQVGVDDAVNKDPVDGVVQVGEHVIVGPGLKCQVLRIMSNMLEVCGRNARLLPCLIIHFSLTISFDSLGGICSRFASLSALKQDRDPMTLTCC